MSYIIRYHPAVRDKDVPKIDKAVRQRIKSAIELRLTTEPLKFGEPLRRTLKGYRKFRVGNYRIVYKIEKQYILILCIANRKIVYEKMEWRKNQR